MGKGETKKFTWNGEQGNYIKEQMKAGVLPKNPSKDEYKGIYESAPEGVLNFQKFLRSWENASRNMEKDKNIADSTGGRKKAATAKAKASDQTPVSSKKQTEANSANKIRSGSKSAAKLSAFGMLDGTPAKNLLWETLHSYWVDKDKHRRLQFFIVLPSGCRPKDIQVSVSGVGRAISLIYTWPEYLFSADRVFEGQNKSYGLNVATRGTAKAAGLNTTTEVMKPTNKSSVHTSLSIQLETKVEESLVDFEGKATTAPFFYKIPDDDWPQFPILIMSIGLMVQRSVGNSFIQEDDEDTDFA
jgi:hypothetical protein